MRNPFRKRSLQALQVLLGREKLGLRGRFKESRAFLDEATYRRFLTGDPSAQPFWFANTLNGVVDEGIEYLLAVAFASTQESVSPIDDWYAGLIQLSGMSLDPGDTLNSKAWTEITNYASSTRPAITWSSPTSRSIEAEIAFTMSGSATVGGLLIADDDEKGGTSGLLWATGEYDDPPSLIMGNVFTTNYILSD